MLRTGVGKEPMKGKCASEGQIGHSPSGCDEDFSLLEIQAGSYSGRVQTRPYGCLGSGFRGCPRGHGGG